MALENLEDAAANESAETILAHAEAENSATEETVTAAPGITSTATTEPSLLANRITKVDVTFTSAIRDLISKRCFILCQLATALVILFKKKGQWFKWSTAYGTIRRKPDKKRN